MLARRLGKLIADPPLLDILIRNSRGPDLTPRPRFAILSCPPNSGAKIMRGQPAMAIGRRSWPTERTPDRDGPGVPARMSCRSFLVAGASSVLGPGVARAQNGIWQESPG